MNTFTVAGTSNLNGVTKVRYANDITRVKNLQKGGHTEIDLIDLGRALPKDEIAAYLQSINFDNGDAVKAEAIAKEVAKRAKAAPAEPTATAAKGVKVTPKVATKTKAAAKVKTEVAAETAAAE
jgi:hypothetical protein